MVISFILGFVFLREDKTIAYCNILHSSTANSPAGIIQYKTDYLANDIFMVPNGFIVISDTNRKEFIAYNKDTDIFNPPQNI